MIETKVTVVTAVTRGVVVHSLHQMFRHEAKMFVERRGRRGIAELVKAENFSVEAHVLAPEVVLPCFDNNVADVDRQAPAR